MVTGCSLNTELKVWSCESWTCLQTISFNRLGEDMGLRLKVDLDPRGRCLVLADINKWVVFVLRVEQGVEEGALVVIVVEFAILSFGCVSADKRIVKQTPNSEDQLTPTYHPHRETLLKPAGWAQDYR